MLGMGAHALLSGHVRSLALVNYRRHASVNWKHAISSYTNLWNHVLSSYFINLRFLKFQSVFNILNFPYICSKITIAEDAIIYNIHTKNINIIFRHSHLHYFFTIYIAWLVRLLTAVIIRYPQIGNELILNAFKNNFDQFLVFRLILKIIMQHRKYV
jgi:hypothetical protein